MTRRSSTLVFLLGKGLARAIVLNAHQDERHLVGAIVGDMTLGLTPLRYPVGKVMALPAI